MPEGRAVSPGVLLARPSSHVAEVTIGAGRRGNALGSADWAALAGLFGELAGDAALRAVLVRGRGGTFSTGSDLHEWVRAEQDAVDAGFAAMAAALTAIEELPVPVIAAVDGVAAGAGCQLALACDLQILAGTARLGMPIARLGILVSPAFAARLTILAGPGVARDLLYTGRLVGAAEAVRLGLATRCVPVGELTAASAALVADTVAHPAAALRAAKRAVSVALAPVRAAVGATDAGPSVAYDEFRAGISAFLSRTEPEESRT